MVSFCIGLGEKKWKKWKKINAGALLLDLLGRPSV
jgi:hypothetical protein